MRYTTLFSFLAAAVTIGSSVSHAIPEDDAARPQTTEQELVNRGPSAETIRKLIGQLGSRDVKLQDEAYDELQGALSFPLTVRMLRFERDRLAGVEHRIPEDVRPKIKMVLEKLRQMPLTECDVIDLALNRIIEASSILKSRDLLDHVFSQLGRNAKAKILRSKTIRSELSQDSFGAMTDKDGIEQINILTHSPIDAINVYLKTLQELGLEPRLSSTLDVYYFQHNRAALPVPHTRTVVVKFKGNFFRIRVSANSLAAREVNSTDVAKEEIFDPKAVIEYVSAQAKLEERSLDSVRPNLKDFSTHHEKLGVVYEVEGDVESAFYTLNIEARNSIRHPLPFLQPELIDQLNEELSHRMQLVLPEDFQVVPSNRIR